MPGLAREMSLDGLAQWAADHGADLASLSFAAPLRDCAVLLVARTRENFDQAHDPNGVAWAPLKRPSRRRGGRTAKPLRDTGLLMASYASGANNVSDITTSSLTWGTNVTYASYHQDGVPSRNLPARPMIGLTEEIVDTMGMILMDWLEKQVV